MRFSFLAAPVLAAALALPAQAQETKADLVEAYISHPVMAEMLSQLWSPELFTESIRASLPPEISVNEEKLAKIGTLYSDELMKVQPEIISIMSVIIEKFYTEEELRAYLAMLDDPIMASAMSKTQPMMQETMGAIMPLMQQVNQTIMPQLFAILQE